MSTALDKALSVLDTFDASDESTALIIAKCRGLMRGYDARWKDAGYVAIDVEQIYHAPLYNPKTNAQSRSFTMAGKLDAMVEIHGRTFIIDHKTTSQDIEDPNAPYWRQLAVEGQVNHYYLLQWVNGIKPDGAVWDAIRKPTISPKKLSKADVAGVVARQTYCGVRMSLDTLTSLQTCERETLEMYEARVTHDCTVERPGWYFQRKPIQRMNHEVHEYASELWEHSQEILHTRQRQKETGQLPPRNSGACLLYGTPCKFLGICSGHDSTTSDRWKQKANVHNELDGKVAADKSALTNSRVRCFQTCRRKEYYEYELAIERNDRDESEALFFGTVLHEALRAWWEHFLKPVEIPHVNGTDAASGELAIVPGDEAQLA